MIVRFLVIALFSFLLVGPAKADDIDKVKEAVRIHFGWQMPTVPPFIGRTAGRCGATATANKDVIYCTSIDLIFLTENAASRPDAPYLVAHAYGHAAQVKHGVADVALSTIRANRDQEAALRMDVERMVDCIAGVILARAGLPATPLDSVYEKEPFTGRHWGRDPLRLGPMVTLGMQDRNAWLQKGHAAGHPSACDTVNFPADLVVAAFSE